MEFSLVAIPTFLLIAAIVQFGYLFSTQLGLVNAARETARLAATVETTNSGEATTNGAWAQNKLTSIVARNIQFYNPAFLSTPPTAVTYCSYTDPNGDTAIRVRVDVYYRHPTFLPLVSGILDGMDGTADGAFLVGTRQEMRVENEPLTNAGGIAAC